MLNTSIKNNNQMNSYQDNETKEMAEAFLNWGLKPSLIHPKSKPFILGFKSDVAVINLEKTKRSLEKAIDYLSNLYQNKKNILIVATAQPAKESAKEMAKELNLPYVTEKWLGGLLTNFEEIKKRVDYYKDLKKKKETGDLEKYPFKERLSLLRELEKLEKNLSGLVDLEKLPEAIFIINVSMHQTALLEAIKKNIPIIALTNVDTDISKINYPIVANDRAKKSVDYVLNKIKTALAKIKPVSKKTETTKVDSQPEKEKETNNQNNQ